MTKQYLKIEMIRKNKNLLILVQDKGISATHPIIFKKNEEEIVVCSISENKRYNYSIILPISKIKNWKSNNNEYFLQCINNTNFYLASEAGHNLAKKYGIPENLIEDVRNEFIQN